MLYTWDYNGEIYDPFDGISDLNNGVVEFIGDPEKEKRKLLKNTEYYRFTTIYNSSIDNKTRKLIQKNADKIISYLLKRIHQNFLRFYPMIMLGK